MAGLSTAGSLLKSIFDVAKAIYQQREQAKSNKKLCQRLEERIRLLMVPLKMLQKDPEKTMGMEETLTAFLSNLEQAKQWVETYSTRGWWKQFFLAVSIYREFFHINDQLTETAQALQILIEVGKRKTFLKMFREPFWKDIIEDIDSFRQSLESEMRAVGDKVDSTNKKLDEVGERMDSGFQKMEELLAAMSITCQNGQPWNIKNIPPTDLKYGDLLITSERYRMYQGEYNKNIVLIKVMVGELQTDKEVVEKTFWEECKTMKKYESPNILQVYGICIDNTSEGPRYSMVTEYCEKGMLRDVLKAEKNLAMEQKLMMALDAARALYSIHRKEMNVIHHSERKTPHQSEKKTVLHGSLSSRKYLVTGYSLKLSGFEFSKTESSMRRNPDKKPEKELELAYCAPETLNNAVYDEHSEIFSLGMVIYEIVTGSLPLQGVSLADGSAGSIHRDLCTEVSDNLPTSCPPVLSGIIWDCLKSDPQSRPTAGDIADRLVAELQRRHL